MYALIQTGGKQYQVKKDDVLNIERMPANDSENIDLTEVLLINDGEKITIGKPYIDGAKVVLQIIEETRGEKIIVFKKKRRQNYRRKNGHKQDLLRVKIIDIIQN
jgi:large subunit ribosomal protein L21